MNKIVIVKKIASITITLFTIFSINNILFADIGSDVRDLSQNLTIKFKEKVKLQDFKFGLAGTIFKNNSKDAKDYNVGSSIRNLILHRFSESRIFQIIDPETTKKILKEMQLKQTGLIKDDGLNLQLSAVDYFLKGSVNETGGQFIVNVNLVSAKTRERFASASLKIDKDNIIQKINNERIAYVTQHSIGISIDYSYFNGSNNNSAGYEYSTILLNYRFTRNLLTSFGISVPFRINNQVNYDFSRQKYTASAIFPEFAKFETNGGIFIDNDSIGQTGPLTGGYGEIGGLYNLRFNDAAIVVNQFYVFNINHLFSLGVGFGFDVYFNPSVEQDYDLIPRRLSHNRAVLDRTVMEVQAKYPIVKFRFELKPEVFITPRLTIKLSIGYAISSPFVSKKAIFRDTAILAQKENQTNNVDEGFHELFGLNPFIDPTTKKNISVNFRGLYFRTGVGLWF